MEIINTTKLTFCSIIGRVGFPKHSLTFVIKGSFDLNNGEVAVISEDQEFPTGDVKYLIDDHDETSYWYESDFAYFKPKADLLLVGTCYTPNNDPLPVCQATFQVGKKAKSLNVCGDRFWTEGAFASMSEPKLFSEMTLSYENSFGGEKYPKNPVGKGCQKKMCVDGIERHALPNIEHRQQRITSPSSTPDPAGFGPVGKMWEPRKSKLGTYNQAWLKEGWPWFPKDFDWSYFNAAPPDMQVEGYLAGDEALFFENLHAEHAQYQAQLPNIRVRMFVNELQGDEGKACFKEVPMKLDTLWVDMDAEKLVLVWRGISPIQSEEYEEIQHVFIAAETIGEPSLSVNEYHDLYLKMLADKADDEEYQVRPVEEVEDSIDLDKELIKAEKQMRVSLLEAGIDPDNLPEPSPEQKAEEAKVLKAMGLEDIPEEVSLSREDVQQRIVEGGAFTEEDLSELDLSGLNMQGMNFQSAILSNVCFKNSDLSGADLMQANLNKADLSHANLQGINLQDADLTGANLVGADLTGAMLEGAIFRKAKMHSALLNQVSAAGAYFTAADLSNAQLTQGLFQGADFSKCLLNMAGFQGAKLCEASVEGAVGIQVNMSGADLTALQAAGGSDFSQGSFRQAKGQESIWGGAKLMGADFSFSHMEGADFSSTILEHANLSAANMKFARFTKANLKAAQLIQINLFQGSLEKADLTGSDLRGANLYAVEFLDAVLEGTRFEQSNLKMTKLSKG